MVLHISTIVANMLTAVLDICYIGLSQFVACARLLCCFLIKETGAGGLAVKSAWGHILRQCSAGLECLLGLLGCVTQWSPMLAVCSLPASFWSCICYLLGP